MNGIKYPEGDVHLNKKLPCRIRGECSQQKWNAETIEVLSSISAISGRLAEILKRQQRRIDGMRKFKEIVERCEAE